MYRLSDLQAVEPEYLTKSDTVLVEIDPELDSMGFNRVDLVAATAEAILDYAELNWGGSAADPTWWQDYVVERIVEVPLAFEQYQHLVLVEEARKLGIPTSLDDPRSPKTVDALRERIAAVKAGRRDRRPLKYRTNLDGSPKEA